MFDWLFSRKPKPDASALFSQLIEAARAVEPFRDLAVEDTFEGRFEHLALVTTLLLERLSALAPQSDALSQELVDLVFTHLDDALRRRGVSDIAVGKRVKKLAKSFYGRLEAYRTALADKNEASLRDALARNLYSSRLTPEAVPAAMLARIATQRAQLAKASFEALQAGEPTLFGPTPFSGKRHDS